MTKMIWTPIAAFSLYLVGIPLVGLAVGLALIAGIPYVFGPVVMAWILAQFLPAPYVFWSVLCGGLAWIILLQMVRSAIKSRKPLAWHQGHYRAAILVLCLGLPYWFGKSESVVEPEEKPSVQPES